MGIADMFAKAVVCPECRSQGAKKGMFGVKCPNFQCAKYDAQLVPIGGVMPPQVLSQAPQLSGNFNPGANAVDIVYRNYRGESRTYSGDYTTLRASKAHVSLCLAPVGKRVTFRKKFIGNLNEVEDAVNRSVQALLAAQAQEAKIPARPVTVKYRNFKGHVMEFKTDMALLQSDQANEQRVILRLTPKGKKFVLKKAQIENSSEIEGKIS